MTITTNLSLTLPDFNTATWHTAINNNLTIIDAAYGVLSLTGVWDNSTAYSVGDRAVDSTTAAVYYCEVGHTSASSGTFEADRTANPTYWSELPQLQSFLSLSDNDESSFTGEAGNVVRVNATEDGIEFWTLAINNDDWSGTDLAIINGGTGASTAADARTNLGVDAAGTDNSTDVTLAGTPDYITISGQEITRGLIDLTTDVSGDLPITEGGTGASDAATARTNLGLAIGSDVQAYDADILVADTENQGPMTGGVTVTQKDLGTISSGTVTPDPGDRAMQKYVNGGAHTLAPSTNYGNFILEIINNASAGAITTSGWDYITGDSFTTTNTDAFLCQCVITPNNSVMIVTALQ